VDVAVVVEVLVVVVRVEADVWGVVEVAVEVVLAGIRTPD